MARKRMIDPDIWTDEKVLKLSWPAVPFYVGLVSQADDDGRIRYSAPSLKAKICPRDDVTEAMAENWMWECVQVGLVLVYASEDVLFAWLPGWLDYQKVQHPTPSRLPEPPGDIREVSRRLLEEYMSTHDISRTFVRTHESSPQVRSDQLDQVRLDRSGGVRGAQTRRPRARVEKSDLPTFGDLEPDVVAFVANAAAENKSGTITPSREFSIRRDLEQAQADLGEGFAAALRETNRHGVPNLNYLRKVAASADRNPRLSAVPVPELHGYLNRQKCATVRGQEPNGWMSVPPPGMHVADVWPEHKHLAADYEPGVA